MSLRRRLTLLTLGAFTIGLLALGFVVPQLVRNFLTQRLDQDLARNRFRALPAILDEQGRAFGTTPEVYFEYRDSSGHLGAYVFSDSTAETKLSPPKLPDVLDLQPDRPFTVDSVSGSAPEHWRVLIYVPPPSQTTGRPFPGSLVVAIPTSTIDATVSETVRDVAIAALITLVLLGLLTYWLVGVGLRPLRKMQQSADGISSAGDLHQRVEHPSEKTELGQLGLTVNNMLGRLETSFEQQQEDQARLRRFVSDASHELRTPLTSIRGYAELHQRGYKDPAQVDRSMYRIEQESSRMSRLVEDLLALARADEKTPMRHASMSFDEVVNGLVDDLRIVHPDRVIWADVAPCSVEGDRALLTQAVANVLANAGVHTPPGTPIEVTLNADDASATLTIVDHGAGIDPAEAAHVFERFYRSDVSRNRASGGSGLGLSITSSIVTAHGGTITTSPTPGGGATFTIVVPASPAPETAAPTREFVVTATPE